MDNLKYIAISPVRDEAEYIEKTINSMEQQTILPKKWIIINDGSTDNTAEIIHTASKRLNWISVVDRPNRGFRKAGSGVINAFYDGFSKINGIKWKYLVKLDGDLSFEHDYFEKCFSYFEENKNLGIAGGLICKLKNGKIINDSPGVPIFHVRGATKIYRYNCWQDIKPLVRAPGWDTIDEVKANRSGWATRTFYDLVLIQHKPTGSADGYWRNWFKNGRANYVAGYHPLFMFGKCVKRMVQQPMIIVSTALLAGYISGYLKKIPRETDIDTIRYLRQEQLKRMMLKRSIYGG